MKSTSIRPSRLGLGTVRVVRDMHDSTKDIFLSEQKVAELLESRILKPIDLGPLYPVAFKYV